MVEVEELCGGEDFCRHEICLPPQVGRGGGGTTFVIALMYRDFLFLLPYYCQHTGSRNFITGCLVIQRKPRLCFSRTEYLLIAVLNSS
jgi:hypothetical protein